MKKKPEVNMKDCLLIKGLLFHKTGYACPEQYDVYKGSKQVGYVRLRFGWLRASYPSYLDETIYEKRYKEVYKGWFFDEDEKITELSKIADCILKKIKGGKKNETRQKRIKKVLRS